jgi:hypothetical protein
MVFLSGAGFRADDFIVNHPRRLARRNNQGRWTMKTILALASAIALALPALAATTTVEFAPATGAAPVIAVFSDDGTVSFNGSDPVTYTMDEAAKTICSSLAGNDECATFETWSTDLGHSAPYTTRSGGSGMATVIAKTE